MDADKGKARVSWKRIAGFGIAGLLIFLLAIAAWLAITFAFLMYSWISYVLLAGALACGAWMFWRTLRHYNGVEESNAILSALLKISAISFIGLLVLYFMNPPLFKTLDERITPACAYSCAYSYQGSSETGSGETGSGLRCLYIACNYVRAFVGVFAMLALIHTIYVLAAKELGARFIR